MKKQILTLIIGILIGAIITTGVFLVLKGNTKGPGNGMNRENFPEMNGEDFPEMNGEFPSDGNGFSRPDKGSKPNSTETIDNSTTEQSSTDE